MQNTSLLEILRTFTPEEIKKFEDFVNSPYFNKKSGVINLYKHIKKYAPEFQNPKLEKEKVWNALYKGKEFNYGVFKNLIYDLTKLSEKFISLECFQEEDLEMSYNLLSSLHKRQIKNIFLSKFLILEKNIDSLQRCKKINFEDYCNIMSKIYYLKVSVSWELDHMHPRVVDEINQHTIFVISNFLYHFLVTACDAVNFSLDIIQDENTIVSFLGKKEAKNFILELIERLKPKSKELYIILSIYYKSYESISNLSSVEKYLDFKEALTTYVNVFSKDDLYNLYTVLQNSCINMISTELNKSKEILDITKLKIRDHVILNPGGLLDPSAFISDIHAAFNMEDSSFIEQYMESFIRHLPNNLRNNMQNYSLAHLYFTKNEFQKSIEQILSIDYDIFDLKYALRNLQAMNYYELNDYNSFLFLFDSYKHFLSKNPSLIERYKESGKLFINNINKLFKLKESFNEYELKNLKKEISVSLEPKIQWLLKKVDELERKVEKV